MAGPAPGAPPPLVSNGWITPLRTTVATAVTVASNDGVIYADATAGVVTVTLPRASTTPAGTRVAVKKKDGGANAVNVVVNPVPGTDTIDGAGSVALAAQFNSVLLICDGVSQWLRGSNAVATGGI